MDRRCHQAAGLSPVLRRHRPCRVQQYAAKDIESSDACGEPLFEAVWDIRVSEVGCAGQRRQYDDRDSIASSVSSTASVTSGATAEQAAPVTSGGSGGGGSSGGGSGGGGNSSSSSSSSDDSSDDSSDGGDGAKRRRMGRCDGCDCSVFRCIC